jgi:hypothetical protein
VTKLLPGVVASGISGNLWAPSGAYEPIGVVNVPSGGITTISFGSIPQTYTHLQLRATVRPTIASDVVLRFNNDATTGNYFSHYINATGAGSVGANGAGSYYGGGIGIGYHDIAIASAFGAHIVDILDYTNTNKNTTVRNSFGVDYNGTGGNQVAFISGSWFSTPAVTTITLYLLSGSGNVFAQNSSIALYGIKGN